MAQIVIMPKEGITVESCIVGQWQKNVGDSVAEGDVLFVYETDKAAFECASTASGVLLHRFYEAGEEAPVLTPAAIVGEAGEDISALTPMVSGKTSAADATKDGNAVSVSAKQDSAEDDDTDTSVLNLSTEAIDAMLVQRAVTGSDEASEPVAASATASNQAEQADEPIASPRARGFAAAQGLDLRAATGSGPNGRILEADVIAAAGATYGRTMAVSEANVSAAEAVVSGTAAPAIRAAVVAAEASVSETTRQDTEKNTMAPLPDKPYTDVAFTKIRSVIAKTMMSSLNRSAQLTHHHSFDATNILAMREEFKNSDERLGYRNVSVGDMILYTASRLLARHPEINALVAEEGVRRYHTVNLGVAVDTPRGLLVPTIFGAERKSLKEISNELKTLAVSAREGRISPDHLAGGTFTISNLGATGVEMFTPIINPPQAAIAGICGVTERVRRGNAGQIEIYPAIGISLSYDHRAVDGAPASRFAAELCEALTQFSWKTLVLELEREVLHYGRQQTL